MSVQSCLALMTVTVAVCMDLMQEKVDNGWILAAWVLGLGYQIGAGGGPGIARFLAGAALPLLLLYILFRFRMLGAGDIKLLSAVGCFMSVSAVCCTKVL